MESKYFIFFLLILSLNFYGCQGLDNENHQPEGDKSSIPQSDERVMPQDNAEIANEANEDSLQLFDSQYRQDFMDHHRIVCVDDLTFFSGTENPIFPVTNAFGPPTGLGAYQGSMDVFVLGEGEMAIFAFQGYQLIDGIGIDLKVFENGFLMAKDSDLGSRDLGFIEFSPGGEGSDPQLWPWYGFDYQDGLQAPGAKSKDERSAMEYVSNLVGINPVIVHFRENAMDPRLESAGGDGFDLGQIRKILDRSDGFPGNYVLGNSLLQDGHLGIRFVKIIDGGSMLEDQQVFSNGLDIDAVCGFYAQTY